MEMGKKLVLCWDVCSYKYATNCRELYLIAYMKGTSRHIYTLMKTNYSVMGESWYVVFDFVMSSVMTLQGGSIMITEKDNKLILAIMYMT